MQSTKKAIKSLIEKEQKRVLLLTLNHDDGLVLNGDNISCANLEDSDVLRQAMKTVLKDEPEEDDASYNFDDRLVFQEDPKKGRVSKIVCQDRWEKREGRRNSKDIVWVHENHWLWVKCPKSQWKR